MSLDPLKEYQTDFGLANERQYWSAIWGIALKNAVEGLTGWKARIFHPDSSERCAYATAVVTDPRTGEQGAIFFKRALVCPLLGRDLNTSEVETIEDLPDSKASEHFKSGTIPFRVVIPDTAIQRYEV